MQRVDDASRKGTQLSQVVPTLPPIAALIVPAGHVAGGEHVGVAGLPPGQRSSYVQTVPPLAAQSVTLRSHVSVSFESMYHCSSADAPPRRPPRQNRAARIGTFDR